MTLRFPSAIPGRVPLTQGKSRDKFPARARKGPYVGKELLAFVATDRVSTHNIVHDSTIPDKGAVLTALTVYWLTRVFPSAGISHHLVAYGKDIYNYLEGKPSDYPRDLHLRCIIVLMVPVLPIEFILRARLGGSLYWKYYSKGTTNPYGVYLPPGLQLMSEFPEPIFTPTEKSETDDPLNAAAVEKEYPAACALARKTYVVGRQHLRARGIECPDTKLEVGHDEQGNPVIVDEVLTPDSSRFCPAESIVLGTEPPHADKQIVRDEAERLWENGSKCPLTFGPDVIRRTTAAYVDIFSRITDYNLRNFQKDILN